MTSVAADSSPQLGGDLDVNGNKITSASNANVEIEPNGTGNILLDSDLITLGSGTEVGHLSTPGTQDIKLSTNSGTDSGTIVITDGANNNITLTPNGTGDVVLAADTVTVGDSGAAATLASNGAGTLTVTTGGAADLVLNTNSGTNSSSLTITDAANGNISATLNGTAVFQIDGSDGVEIEQGAISIKNGGAESYVRFYCESSNAHYTQLQASPHSAYSGNVTVVLPAAATNLVGDDTTQTLTNKTLTTPVIAEITSGSTITLNATTDIVLDADGDEVIFKDGSTNVGHVSMDSDNLTIKSLVSDKDMIFQGNDGGTGITALTLDMSGAGAATFNNNVTAFSDERLKSDITTLKSSLEKVLQMRGVSYTRNDNVEGGEQIGVIAQEVEKFYPQVVLTADDEQGTKSVDYGRLTAVLIEAVKELSELVNRDITSIKKDIDAICQHPLWQEKQMKGD